MTTKWVMWPWREKPEAPRSWRNPSSIVVLTSDWIGGDPAIATTAPSDTGKDAAAAWSSFAGAGPVFEREDGPVLITTETVETLERMHALQVTLGSRTIPAVRLERRGYDYERALDALARVSARHRALVLTPRECIVIGLLGTAPKVWGRGYTPLAAVFDLVIVAPPKDEEPMHPNHIRALRDEAAFAGVAFAFLGWGSWAPQTNRARAAHGCFNIEGHFIRGGRSLHGQNMMRLGAGKSGRLLDGKEHLALPEGL